MKHSMKTTAILFCIYSLCCTWCAAAPDANDKSATVFTCGTYIATVADDGSMTSLKIKGKEFLHTNGSNPRGVYLYQGTAFGLKNISCPERDKLVASNDQAVVTYTFGAESISWNVRNLTDKKLTLLIAFAPGVKAVRHATGLYEKTPYTTGVTDTTWFQSGLKLDIDNGGRIWGPWSDQKLQIWQIDIDAKTEHTSTFTMGIADKEEQAAVEAALNYVAAPPTDPAGSMWDLAKLSAPPATRPAEEFKEEGVSAIFYEGLPYRGRPTEVFAYSELPDIDFILRLSC